MNCHQCKHRNEIPGSTHSECKCELAELYKPLAWIILSQCVGDARPLGVIVDKETGNELGTPIEINPTGIRGGWAMWPFNFDPVWVKSCMMFEEKGNKTAF